MVTLERMQMDMREFMVAEDLEEVIWRVTEFLNLLSPTFHEKGESSSNVSTWLKSKSK